MNKRLIKISSLMILGAMILSLACNLPIQAAQPTTTGEVQPPTTIPSPTQAKEEIFTQAAQTVEAQDTPVQPTEDTSPKGLDLTAAEVYMAGFAAYPTTDVRLPDKFAGGYTLPLDLNQVKGLELFDLSPQQLDSLSRNGFVVKPTAPGEFREFYQVYEFYRYDEMQPFFITTDAVFHVYHLVFDKILRDLEREHFIPALEKMTSAMIGASLQQYQSLRGTALEEQTLRNLAFFCVAGQLLQLPDPVPGEVSDLVNAELALIDQHGGAAISPIWDRPDLEGDKKLIEDYSQYVPRGHYTRSDELKRYFRAMMWYGRMTLRLRDDFETQRALLMTQALRTTTAQDGTKASDLWKLIYEPTVFIVGKADDLSFYEYGVISDAVFGENADPRSFADPTLFAEFKATAKKLPPPQVNSMWVWIWEDKTEATQGFRVMGQRFTLDQYVFGQVMWRNVGTMDNPRDLPKALDFFAAMGSEEALNILTEMGEPNYENYTAQMEKVKAQVATLELDSWTQNLYWSWLYSFQPLLTVKDQRYPAFMQTQAWQRKDLNTALGSWTELKHDTILYAKQVMAEMGGGEPEFPPHSLVEPNPEVFARLYSLTQMTYQGLAERGLLTSEMDGTLTNLSDLILFLKGCSERHLRGETLSDDDYWRLKYFGGELEALTLAAADRGEMDYSLEDQKAALVADVATGIDRVLEEAIGQPFIIYVVLPDEPWRIGVGAVFSYYEFIVSPSDRMTDETWQGMVESGNTPPLPEWTSSFIVP